jgi:hypothetical protein
MARDGSGTYTNPYPNFVSGTVISSTEVDTNNSQIATALTQSIAVDGQAVVTADLPLATHKFTGMKVGTASTDSLSLGQAQAEAFVWCGTAGGSADAITLTPSPPITAYAPGQRFVWMASGVTNTTATTVAISGLGAIALQDNGAALTAGQHAAAKMFMGILNTTSTVQLMQVQVSGTDPLIISSLTVDGNSQFNGTITAGVDDTGYDVQFFGATSGAHMLWDASVDDLKLVGAAGLTVAGNSTLNIVNVNQTLTVGVDDTGYDVQFFGATASAHLLWDASEDDLKLVGAAGLTVAGNSVLNTLDVNSTLDVGGAATFTTEITANGGIALGDSDEATFGASDDLKIYHDGSNSRINDSGTGVLVLQGSEVHVNNAASDENMISAVQDGAVTLHHNGSARVATSDDGATVTGNLLFGTSSKGVYLGVTSATAANLLDDYEEGTWTGTLLGSTTTPGSITATGYYTKYGRDVHASLYLQNVNTTGFAGDIQISGLPFTVSSTTVGSAGLYNIALQHAVGAFSRADSTTDDVKFFKSRDATTWISASHSAGTGRYLLLDVTYILT